MIAGLSITTLLWLSLAIGCVFSFLKIRNRRNSLPETPHALSFHAAMNLPAERRAAFILCTFSLLGKIAACDGETSSEEIARVEEYIQSHLKLTPQVRSLALSIFHESCSSPLEFRDYVNEFKKSFPDRVQLHTTLLETLLLVTTADGILSNREEEALRSIALQLGFPAPHFELRLARYLGYH